MKLSIIVPVYNTAANGILEFCLDSLVNQTFIKNGGAMEIIAVDDCSTDNSLEVLRFYENIYPEFFRVIHSDKNVGPGGARNLGFKHAKGEWIGYVDSDDWVAKDYYEKAFEAITAVGGGVDMVAFGYCRVATHTFTPTTPIHHEALLNPGIVDHERRKLLLLDAGSVSNKIYKRRVIFGDESKNKDCKVFPEGIFYEDNAVAFSIRMRVKRFIYLPEPRYFYFQRPGSITHNLTSRHLSDRWISCHMILDNAIKDGYLEEFLPEMEFLFTSLFYVNTLLMVMPYEFQEKKDFIKNLVREQKRVCPNFKKNLYYQKRIDAQSRGIANLIADIL